MFIPVYMLIPLWIFAIFGFLYFIFHLFKDLVFKNGRLKNTCAVIISAKNQEDVIEGIVRGFILKANAEDKEELLLNLVLVDAGSSDDTPRIMQHLAKDYTYIKFIKPEEVKCFIRSFMNR